MANSKITVESLNLHYGENHALKNVNMEIADHAITAFIGPSGCGKSTFLRCLNRMNDLVDGCRVEGKVILDGEDIYDKRVDTTLLRKKVGMVFQPVSYTHLPHTINRFDICVAIRFNLTANTADRSSKGMFIYIFFINIPQFF